MDILTIPSKTKTGEPISLAEAKRQLQVESNFTADDLFISSLVEIALDKIENDTNSDVLETLNILIYTPETVVSGSYIIHQAPLLSFTKLEKLNGSTWSTVTATAYQVTPSFNRFEVEILETITADQLRFTYKTGYEAPDIPRALKGAVLVKVADLFDSERQGYTQNVAANRAYESLIYKHIRTYWG